MTAERYRAIEHNYDLLRWAVEDTHTQRHCGDEGEGEILCHCFDSDEAKTVAQAMNASDAELRARVRAVLVKARQYDVLAKARGQECVSAVVEDLVAALKA